MTTHRLLMVAAAAATTAIMILVILFGVALLVRPMTPLRYPVPQTVLNAGQIHVGGVVETEAVKCNSAVYTIETVGSHVWRPVDGDGKPNGSAIAQSAPGLAEHPNGCETLRYRNVIPPEVRPGHWRIEGFEVVVNGQQRIAWYTAPFEVLP